MCKEAGLRHPDLQREFVLITDASDRGVGACLLQADPDDAEMLYVVEFYSRKLSETEQNYCMTEWEALVIYEAMMRFYDFLIQQKFKLITDHAALTYIFGPNAACETCSKAKRMSKLTRWAMSMSTFDFDIEHRAGERIPQADFLSRHDLPVGIPIHRRKKWTCRPIKQAAVHDPPLETKTLEETQGDSAWTGVS